MSTALYRKYRSRSLNEVVGQPHITDILSRSIKTGTTSHAYLLTGPRGVGKTSIARILAHEINAIPYSDDTHLDIIEIDAASNNSVEDVRDLREKVHIAPTSAKKKIYIIDEVHMLSKAAFNALLKTLEEPPAHIVFILATTDLEKLPATIISRTQRFHLKTISVDDIAGHLRTIADQEAISITDAALVRIAEHGEGTFRDSISLLDQLRYLCPEGKTIDDTDINQALGMTSQESLDTVINAYRSADHQTIIRTLLDLESQGIQATTVTKQLISLLTKQLTAQPDSIEVLSNLAQIKASSYPYVQLIAALMPTQRTQSTPQQQTTPTPAPQQHTPPAQPSVKKTPPKPQQPQTPKPTPAKPTPTPPKEDTPVVDGDGSKFVWNDFLPKVKEQSAGAFGILQNAAHRIDDNTLVIYTGNKFKANTLSSPKTSAILHAVLAQLPCGALALKVHATNAPPKNQAAATVASVMGGGEEVDV